MLFRSIPGEINVKVEPSAKAHPGVYVHVNHHLDIEKALEDSVVSAADYCSDLLQNQWDRLIDDADKMVAAILEEASK